MQKRRQRLARRDLRRTEPHDVDLPADELDCSEAGEAALGEMPCQAQAQAAGEKGADESGVTCRNGVL